MISADGGTLRGLSGTPDYVAPEVLSWCAARATPPRNSAAQFPRNSDAQLLRAIFRANS